MKFSPYRINDQTIREIQKEYLKSDLLWIIGYSGGKDSSALLKLVFLALFHLEDKSKPVTVIYCDTGVEIPVVRDLATQTLRNISVEAERYGLPIHVRCVSPQPKDRYFVKVIGRGYPPPSNKFRWCTRRLRTNPVKQALASVPGGRSVVLLGMRRGESQERDRTITKHKTGEQHYFRHSDNEGSLLYCPIINYGLEEVWNTLTFNFLPESIDVNALLTLYKESSGECPIIHDPQGPPCAKGRFGCWTCTVVRKDHAVESMVREGHVELAPLLDFRNWLVSIRDGQEYRCRKRRNGAPGLGPFTLAARQEILKQLLNAQDLSGLSLITDAELNLIEEYWRLDENSNSYTEC